MPTCCWRSENFCDTPTHVIGEERQLTAILRTVLTHKLGETSLIVSNGILTKPAIESEESFSRYTGNADLCIYGYSCSSAIVTGNGSVTQIDGVAVEGKRHEFALDQCIADMIKLGADLLELNLRGGHMVNDVTIFGKQLVITSTKQGWHNNLVNAVHTY